MRRLKLLLAQWLGVGPQPIMSELVVRQIGEDLYDAIVEVQREHGVRLWFSGTRDGDLVFMAYPQR